MENVNSIIHADDEMMGFFKSIGKSEQDYLNSGRDHFNAFFEYIRKHRPSLLQKKSILDYGCGHGRITRFIAKILSPEKLVVADVWDNAVNFSAKEFQGIPFVVSDSNPISKLGLKYDIIISYSVFSHLPPQRFEFNLRELKNSLNENGILLFTTHGDYHANLHQLTRNDGFHYGSLGQKPNHTDGRLSGEEYSFMCVTKDYVNKILDKVDLNLIEHIQDVNKFSGQELYIVEIKK